MLPVEVVASNSYVINSAPKKRSGIKTYIKENLKANADGDQKKNGLAIAGFITSLVGLFIWPVAIVGIVLSAIGLKSEKRGLALAGLIIGIVAVVGGLILASTL